MKGKTNAVSGGKLDFNETVQTSTNTTDVKTWTFNNLIKGEIYCLISTNKTSNDYPFTVNENECEILSPRKVSYHTNSDVTVARMIVRAKGTSITMSSPTAYNWYTYRLM